MLHLAIICMVCAVSAPIEGTALIGVKNNDSNIFCQLDERNQKQIGKYFPGLYNVDVKNCLDCAKQKVTDRTGCVFYNHFTKQCQFSKDLCSFKKNFCIRNKKSSRPRLDYKIKKRKIHGAIRNKGKQWKNKKLYLHMKDKEEEEDPDDCVKYTRLSFYERNKLRRLTKVGKNKRKTRRRRLDYKIDPANWNLDQKIDEVVRLVKLAKAKDDEMTTEKIMYYPSSESVDMTVKCIDVTTNGFETGSHIAETTTEFAEVSTKCADKTTKSDETTATKKEETTIAEKAETITKSSESAEVITKHEETTKGKGSFIPFLNNFKHFFRLTQQHNKHKHRNQFSDGVEGNKNSISFRMIQLNNYDNPQYYKKIVRVKKDPHYRRRHKIVKRSAKTHVGNNPRFYPKKKKRRRRKSDHLRHKSNFAYSPLDQEWQHRNLFSSVSKTSFPSKERDYEEPIANGTQQIDDFDDDATDLPSSDNSSPPFADINDDYNASDIYPDSNSLYDGRMNEKDAMMHEYNNRNFFVHTIERPMSQEESDLYDGQDKQKSSGFPHDRKLQFKPLLNSGRYLKIRHVLRNMVQRNNDLELQKRLYWMERKKRCEGKSNGIPHKCWRTAPLLCVPYIKKGQDEMLRYLIKTMQEMLGKPLPDKIDIFEKTKYKPCQRTKDMNRDRILALKRPPPPLLTTTTCPPPPFTTPCSAFLAPVIPPYAIWSTISPNFPMGTPIPVTNCLQIEAVSCPTPPPPPSPGQANQNPSPNGPSIYFASTTFTPGDGGPTTLEPPTYEPTTCFGTKSMPGTTSFATPTATFRSHSNIGALNESMAFPVSGPYIDVSTMFFTYPVTTSTSTTTTTSTSSTTTATTTTTTTPATPTTFSPSSISFLFPNIVSSTNAMVSTPTYRIFPSIIDTTITPPPPTTTPQSTNATNTEALFETATESYTYFTSFYYTTSATATSVPVVSHPNNGPPGPGRSLINPPTPKSGEPSGTEVQAEDVQESAFAVILVTPTVHPTTPSTTTSTVPPTVPPTAPQVQVKENPSSATTPTTSVTKQESEATSPATPVVPVTQDPMNWYQMTITEEKPQNGGNPQENIGDEQNPDRPPLSRGYVFPPLPPRKPNLRGMVVTALPKVNPQNLITSPPVQYMQFAVPATTPNTLTWYYANNPAEHPEYFPFTNYAVTPNPDPNSYYQYLQAFTPVYENPNPAGPVMPNQMYKMYFYNTEKIPTQKGWLAKSWSASTTMSLAEFDLSDFNDRLKSSYNKMCYDTPGDYLPNPDTSLNKDDKTKKLLQDCEKLRLKEDDNSLFPGDPFNFKYLDSTEKYMPRLVRPRLHRKKVPKLIHKTNRKFNIPNYDSNPEESFERPQQPSQNNKYEDLYDRYQMRKPSSKDFHRKRKAQKYVNNQIRKKRESVYKDSYSWPRNPDNYDNYAYYSNYDDQYPENLLLPKLESENAKWSGKREEKNSSSSGAFALLNELAQMVTMPPNQTEAGEQAANITSTEPTAKPSPNPTQPNTTHVHASPRVVAIDKFDKEQKSGYDNCVNPTVPILSAGHSTTHRQITATTSGEMVSTTSGSTTMEYKASNHTIKSNEGKNVQIVDSGKPDKEVGSNHDIQPGDEQMVTTLKTASIVKGPKKLLTKPVPKIYTKVYPDSLSNEIETNEAPGTTTTMKADKTTVIQALAAPDVRLQLLAVCEGYLEVVKLIKAQNQSLEEELDSDLSRYCENIISQSFNLPADNVIIKNKKPERSSPSTTTSQTASKNSNNLISRFRPRERFRAKKDVLSHQDLRAKVVVDILRSPIYRRELAAYNDQRNFYPMERKIKGMIGPKMRFRRRLRRKKDFLTSRIGLRKQRNRPRRKKGINEEFSNSRISQEEIELLHLLQKRKKALLSWLYNPNQNELKLKPNELEETEYLDDDEYYTISGETTEDSGTVTPKGDQEETSETTVMTTSTTTTTTTTTTATAATTRSSNETIFPVYAKQYGYDRGGELREVEVLWRRENEETHEKKIFKNMSVLAMLLTSTAPPYLSRKETKQPVGGNVYETDEMSEILSNSDNKAGFIDPTSSFNEDLSTTPLSALQSESTTVYIVTYNSLENFTPPSLEISSPTTTTPISSTSTMSTLSTTTCPSTTSTAITLHTPILQNASSLSILSDSTIPQSLYSSKKNQTYIFMRKPDPSTIVGTAPNRTRSLKNSTHKMSHKLEIARDFLQEYSIEFLNYAVYILPIMFTILFIMCCLCCFLQILNSRAGGKPKKKKKRVLSTEEDCYTTGDSEGEAKKRKKKKRKKSMKNDMDSENRRLGAFWNVLKMNPGGKQGADLHEEPTASDKRRSFLQFLKGKKGSVKPEELASLSYPPALEHGECSDHAPKKKKCDSNTDDDFDKKRKAGREKEAQERRELITLLEELKRIELENLQQRKNKKSVYVQYMSQDEDSKAFKQQNIPCSYQYMKSNPFGDKQFPYQEPNPSGQGDNYANYDLHEDLGEFMEFIPYEGEYFCRKNDYLRHSNFRMNRGGRCEKFLKLFRGTGMSRGRAFGNMNFTGNGNKSYIYSKYKNISTDTKDELMGGTHKSAETENSLSDNNILDSFSPYSLPSKKETDIVDEMENLKRQLNKKKNVRLKDNGVLCRL